MSHHPYLIFSLLILPLSDAFMFGSSMCGCPPPPPPPCNCGGGAASAPVAQAQYSSYPQQSFQSDYVPQQTYQAQYAQASIPQPVLAQQYAPNVPFQSAASMVYPSTQVPSYDNGQVAQQQGAGYIVAESAVIDQLSKSLDQPFVKSAVPARLMENEYIRGQSNVQYAEIPPGVTVEQVAQQLANEGAAYVTTNDGNMYRQEQQNAFALQRPAVSSIQTSTAPYPKASVPREQYLRQPEAVVERRVIEALPPVQQSQPSAHFSSDPAVVEVGASNEEVAEVEQTASQKDAPPLKTNTQDTTSQIVPSPEFIAASDAAAVSQSIKDLPPFESTIKDVDDINHQPTSPIKPPAPTIIAGESEFQGVPLTEENLLENTVESEVGEFFQNTDPVQRAVMNNVQQESKTLHFTPPDIKMRRNIVDSDRRPIPSPKDEIVPIVETPSTTEQAPPPPSEDEVHLMTKEDVQLERELAAQTAMTPHAELPDGVEMVMVEGGEGGNKVDGVEGEGRAEEQGGIREIESMSDDGMRLEEEGGEITEEELDARIEAVVAKAENEAGIARDQPFEDLPHRDRAFGFARW